MFSSGDRSLYCIASSCPTSDRKPRCSTAAAASAGSPFHQGGDTFFRQNFWNKFGAKPRYTWLELSSFFWVWPHIYYDFQVGNKDIARRLHLNISTAFCDILIQGILKCRMSWWHSGRRFKVESKIQRFQLNFPVFSRGSAQLRLVWLKMDWFLDSPKFDDLKLKIKKVSKQVFKYNVKVRKKGVTWSFRTLLLCQPPNP